MDLVRFLVGMALLGPAVLGVALPVVAYFMVRRSLRVGPVVSPIVPTRHPRTALLLALVVWAAVVASATSLGVLVGFGAAWAQAHSARSAAAPDFTGLLGFVAGSAVVMVGIAFVLGRVLQSRYRAMNHVNA
jgi:hypothetical protein